MALLVFEKPDVTRAESTPDNLRRRGGEDLRRAKQAEKNGDHEGAQSFRNQAYIKFAIAAALTVAAAVGVAKAADVF